MSQTTYLTVPQQKRFTTKNWLAVIAGVAAILTGFVMLYEGLKGT